MSYTLKKGTTYRVRKVGTSKNPVAPSEEWEDVVMMRQMREAIGSDSAYEVVAGGDASVPVEYEVVVKVDKDISEGDNFSGLRTERNGVNALGYFVTSPIQKIDEDAQTFETLNSVYHWTVEN